MPTFAYSARDHAGSPLSGSLVANSAVEVTQMLRADGKYPTAVSMVDDQTEQERATRAGLRMGRKDLIQFATQLGIMIETGVTLSEGLDCIAAQADKPNVCKIVQDISEQVQQGSTFSAALSRHPRAFPRLFIALIAASEQSGMMAKLLQRAVAYLRDEYDTIRKVRGALTYPAIMLLFALSTTVFLLAFVMPKFTAIYAAKSAALPVPTQILMSISDCVVGQWPWILGGVAFTAGMMWIFLRSPRGRRAFHYVQLHTPLIGGVLCKLHLSRGLRMVGTMAGAGVNLVDAVKTAHDLCSNSYFRDLWDEVSQQIQSGKQLSEPLFRSALVPRSVSQMLHSAEKGGKLASVMEQVSGFAEAELKEKITELTRYIEPIMISLMGVLIGGVALALMLPIFTISKVMVK